MSYVADFRDYLSRRTDAPPIFHVHAALCLLAVAMGCATAGWMVTGASYFPT
jgi:hypothetical protein